MKKYIKVKDNKNLFRDEKTNAIVNLNTDEYNNYLNKRKSRLERDKRIDCVISDVENLKSDISEIKQLLKNIVDNFN
jgi:hypothetical protein